MNVLVLGGTLFLGRHVVVAAHAAGHRVTIFTRGRTNPTIHPDIERLRGDRNDDVAALTGRTFDLVIDTSAYHPRHVSLVAGVLGAIGRYALVSTVSVYRDFSATETTEDAPTHTPLWDETAVVDGDTYGLLKVACEETARRVFGTQTLIARPGLLVGPYDPTNRFSYWVRRLARGGEVLAPGRPDRAIQVLDARDLATWLVGHAAGLSGTFNTAGPTEPLTMGDALGLCASSARSAARVTWVGDEFLLSHGVEPWTELPLWVPDSAGVGPLVNAGRALQSGLRCRPLGDTVGDILAEGGDVDTPRAGGPGKGGPLTRAREAELLAAWHEQRAAAGGAS